jgi:hypothetical protein
VFEQNGVQYVDIATLTPRKRVAIPLKGHTTIAGNVRLVLRRASRTVAVHVSFDVEPRRRTALADDAVEPHDPIAAADAGTTEVATDEEGTRYGAGYGKVLAKHTATLDATGRARNKIRSVAERHRERGNTKKAARIEKNNLGTVKLDARRARPGRDRRRRQHRPQRAHPHASTNHPRDRGPLAPVPPRPPRPQDAAPDGGLLGAGHPARGRRLQSSGGRFPPRPRPRGVQQPGLSRVRFRLPTEPPGGHVCVPLLRARC